MSLTPPSRACALCSAPAKYTCPRCRTPSCSLPCARQHKHRTGCSGARNAAEYVPMNAYGWGAMMRDFCFLEDVGRRVGAWGDEIARGGYRAPEPRGGRGRGRGGRTGREGAGRWRQQRQAAGCAKRETLAACLESLDVEIDLLPVGMERRSASRSTWDPKTKRPLLTVELKFHPPSTDGLHTVLTHRNLMSRTLLETMRSHLPQSRRQKNNALPEWVPPMVHPSPDDPQGFVPPDCYISANIDFPRPPNCETYYHKLDSTLSLSELLRGTRFAEFPTIHVFDPDASSFRGTVVDKAGRPQQRSRPPKRRKLDPQVIAGLLAGYNSESDSGSENDGTQTKAVLDMLATYSDTGPEDDGAGDSSAHGEDDEDDDDDDDDDQGSSSSEAEEPRMEPEKLLELMRQAGQVAGEDLADWGDELQSLG